MRLPPAPDDRSRSLLALGNENGILYATMAPTGEWRFPGRADASSPPDRPRRSPGGGPRGGCCALVRPVRPDRERPRERPCVPPLRLRAVLARARRGRGARLRPPRAGSSRAGCRSRKRRPTSSAPASRSKLATTASISTIRRATASSSFPTGRPTIRGRTSPARPTSSRASAPASSGTRTSSPRELEAQTAFYTDVLGMRVTDRLGDEGIWFHVNADHHVLAFVDKGYAAPAPPCARDGRLGRAQSRLRSPCPARPLARLGAAPSRARRAI